MADGVDVFTAGRVWTIKFHSGAGTALPLQLCPYDLIPQRIVWVPAAATNQVILQSQPTGGTATDVYNQLAANTNPTEQRPDGKDCWSGPIVITTMTGGELLITL